MAQTSEYQTAAEEFLKRHNITFSQEFVGKDCPLFCDDALKRIDMDKLSAFPRKAHIHGYHYRCTFTKAPPPNDLANRMDQAYRGKVSVRPLVIDFWNSYADEEFNYLLGNERGIAASKTLYLRHGFKDGPLGYRPPMEQRPGRDGAIKWLPVRRKVPTAYDLLACIENNDPGTFEDFCSNFGYDTDSRRAEAAYKAVQQQWRDVERFFTAEELAEAQEIS